MIAPKETDNVHSGDGVGTVTAKKESERVKVKGWPGYVRGGVFVIEKRIHGKKWHFSTRCTTLRAAMRQLERFEESPSTYRPDGGDGPALALDEAMIDRFFAWHSAHTSRPWALNVRSLLVDWANHLRGSDLRKLSLVADLKPHLAGATQNPHRVKAIRLLFKWLRTELGVIDRAQDVTLDLAVPPAKPAQWSRSKAVAWERVLELLPHLRADVRDVLELLAATGWHISEARRFAAGGTLREREASDPPHVVAVIGVRHKSGKPHFTALVHERHAQVARRVRERGHVIDNGALRKQMLRGFAAVDAARKQADADAKPAERFQLGSMRHSLTNWLADAGVSVEERGKYLGHNPGTNARFYVDAQRPPVVMPQQVLRVVP